ATHGLPVAESKGGWIGELCKFPSTMAQNCWIANFGWLACFVVTLAVSAMTRPRPDAELSGLVYGLTEMPKDEGKTWYERPLPLACVVGAVLLLLNLWFW